MISNKLTSNIENRNEYNFTALYASYLRRRRNLWVKDEDGNDIKMKFDGFIYKSVKSNNSDELNLAFFPDVIDKWANLDYVLKGTINDLYSTITAFKGVYNGKDILWSKTKEEYKLKNL